MNLVFKSTFISRLENQIEYISLDSPKRARKFKSELLNRIKEIPSSPYRFRKSVYFEDDFIRDMIYKGYTVVFRINGDRIEVFGFINYQKNPTD